MSDENKNDEYQFSELDSNQIFDEDTSMDSVKTSMPADNNLKKFIIIGFGVVVVAFILYKFLGSYFVSDKNIKHNISKNSKPSVVNLATVKPKLIVPVKTMKPKVVKTFTQPQFNSFKPAVTTDPKVKQKLNALQYSSNQSSRKISNIDNNLGDLKNSVEALNSKIISLNSNITLLSQEIQNQQEMINKLKKPKKKLVRKNITRQAPRQYFIQALIPGRAWLRTTRGDSITVVVGTRIRGLGVVQLIDPQDGQVIMRTGKVIKFSSSDT